MRIADDRYVLDENFLLRYVQIMKQILDEAHIEYSIAPCKCLAEGLCNNTEREK